jgi:HAMP domain-containing protein
MLLAGANATLREVNMMPRIPLPFKLLLSYLCIVAIGAGPTFIYVRAKLQADLMADAAWRLVTRGRRVARVLSSAQAAERLPDLHLLGEASIDRITFLSPHGDVLYDNDVPGSVRLENHLSRPEVRFAMGDKSAPQADFADQVPGAEGVGISRRVSETTHSDTLYVALRISVPPDETIGILRVAAPVDRIQSMTSGTMHFARNAQALAVSLAIGFSLLTALLFVRPLQRVGRMVQALADGDIGAQVGQLGNDEVGDVGRALEQMAMALRRKLLAAGLGEALLGQLVEALSTPCMAFEEGGDVIAMNGAARLSLGIEGQAAGRRMKEFAENPTVLGAVSTAEYEGEPEPFTVQLSWQGEVAGYMHVLKRPGMAPLRVFIGKDAPPQSMLALPNPDEVQPRPIRAVLEDALLQASASLSLTGVTVELPPAGSGTLVVDATGRVASAIADAVNGCARALEGRKQALSISLLDEPLRLRVLLEGALPFDAVEPIRKKLEPLGGSLEALSTETHLWLPKA